MNIREIIHEIEQAHSVMVEVRMTEMEFHFIYAQRDAVLRLVRRLEEERQGREDFLGRKVKMPQGHDIFIVGSLT